ncbi:hypothetical protein HF325_005580 [Metschnikowia pulcherrima]|uniref:D-serine dehydratase n=1 Tax=Metschnikowia pulcherrima TaxID=27326 RepID=A0A8H7GNG7_9ASCO|nr:hypothetical protein HF325_005580 [Metschnikowia pulcherrima]
MSIPSSFYKAPEKELLLKEYVGKSLSELPTPSIVIDRARFVENSRAMLKSAARLNAGFRCHIKTHKAVEGVNVQLGYEFEGEQVSEDIPKSDKIVVSTLAEAWAVIPLVEQGKIRDILFGLPVTKLRIGELHELSKKVDNVRVMVDSPPQVEALYDVFIKIDMGTGRAGIGENSTLYDKLLDTILKSDAKNYVSLYGLYCHAGHSYGAKGAKDAESFLVEEVRHVNAAAKHAKTLAPHLQLHLSVGATPTAHVSRQINLVTDLETAIGEPLVGTLEVHAGNYSCCDLQQVATGLVEDEDVSLFLLAEVLTQYEGRKRQVTRRTAYKCRRNCFIERSGSVTRIRQGGQACRIRAMACWKS